LTTGFTQAYVISIGMTDSSGLRFRKIFEGGFFALALLTLTLQGVHSIRFITLNSADRSLVGTNDADGATAIHVLMKTRFLNDNGWYAYGPFYYRLSKLLYLNVSNSQRDASFSLGAPAPTLLTPTLTLKEEQDKQRTRHFALQLTSWLSLLGISVLVSILLFRSASERMVGVAAINWLLLSNEIWAKFLFVAHPDLLMGALIAWATWLLLRLGQAETSRSRWSYALGAALLFGVAVSTKLSAALFLASSLSFLVLFASGFKKKERLILAVSMGLAALLAYFLIGFPQNFQIRKLLDFMAELNRTFAPLTLAAFVEWLRTFLQQAGLPLAGLVVLSLLRTPTAPPAGETLANPTRFPLFRFLALFWGLPFAYLITKNITMPVQHYLIPFVSSLLVIVALALSRRQWVAPWRRTAWSGILLFLLLNPLPPAVQAQYQAATQCRDQARNVRERLNVTEKGGALVADYYIPFYEDIIPLRNGALLMEDLERPATVLALHASYDHQFLGPGEPSEYVRNGYPRWREHRAFYEATSQKSEFRDSKGFKWSRIYWDTCSFEIYVKDQPPHLTR
jgi:hypothetical protein